MGDSVSDANGCFLVKMHFLKVVPVVSPGSREKILEILLVPSPTVTAGGSTRGSKKLYRFHKCPGLLPKCLGVDLDKSLAHESMLLAEMQNGNNPL